MRGSGLRILFAQHPYQGAVARPAADKCGRHFGIEIKRMDAPLLTGSMRIALANLRLAHLTVVYLGKQSL
jgi:hypothetical protein